MNVYSVLACALELLSISFVGGILCTFTPPGTLEDKTQRQTNNNIGHDKGLVTWLQDLFALPPFLFCCVSAGWARHLPW